MNNCAS